jgi:hypothetical protein
VTASSTESSKDECYRCGYDLRGIANDAACPECGLLAERSRRITDELHDTRPRWLRSLSWGINLILLALVAPLVGLFIFPVLDTSFNWLGFRFPVTEEFFNVLGFDLAAAFLALGVFLLTRPEGYAPADRADRDLRFWLRMLAIVPALAMVIVHSYAPVLVGIGGALMESQLWAWAPIFTAIVAFLPLLLFIHLRGLAKRARSAHLAEHCMIVGIGTFASLLYVAAVNALVNNAQGLGLEADWETRSTVSLIMMLVLGIASALFLLWSLYLLLSFAEAFWTAARTLRCKWSRDDRSVTR